jgi:ferredoxin/flavodoxin---NADP+ reductase
MELKMNGLIGSKSRPLTVAIIGSGPSGFYAADHLMKQEDINIEVDIFEKLPTPYGLVRAGVAPDHQQIKSVSKIYEKLAQNPRFRFWGNVELGKDIQKSEFFNYFDAIIYAVGAQSDRSMNIKGEELIGSYSATEFVGWYNGHPDYRNLEFDFSGENAVIIGIGNVALDIARILAKSIDELSKTDITQHALDNLALSKIKNIYVIARRGPMQSAFTPAGTKELFKMEDAAAFVKPEELKIEKETKNIITESGDKRIIQNLQFLENISKNDPAQYSKIIQILFRRSPLELYGSDIKVSGIKIVKNELFQDEFGNLKAKATDVMEDIPTNLVFSSIGYKVNPMHDVSFDDKNGIIANQNGRVYDLANNIVIENEYVTGWAKRGPSGVIGTNKPDSIETVNFLLDDFKNKTAENLSDSQESRIHSWLKSKNLQFVPFDQWKILDTHETALGESKEKPREKVTSIAEMLKIIEKES